MLLRLRTIVRYGNTKREISEVSENFMLKNRLLVNQAKTIPDNKDYNHV